MLDYHHGVPRIAQLSQKRQEGRRVFGVQTHGRLIEDVQRIHQPSAQRVGEIDTLGLAP